METLLALATALVLGTAPAEIGRADHLVLGTAPAEVGRTDLLVLHSDPWINLHHFLYQWARDEAGVASGREFVDVRERTELGTLPADDRRIWEQAVAFYVQNLAQHGHFDDRMWAIKTGLLELAERPDAAPSDVIPPDSVPGVAAQLEAAMPIYQDRWWSGHDRANRDWIADVLPLAQEYEPRFVEHMERSYGGDWTDPLRVDVSAYANWAGGYTSNGPPHTVVWSRDPNNAGMKGLEMVYHEAGHIRALARPNRNGLRAAFEADGMDAPRNLWHTVIFYTAGWVTQGIAQERGMTDYVPYFLDQGLNDFRGWQGLWPALEVDWTPLLEGRVGRDEALAAVAGRLPD